MQQNVVAVLSAVRTPGPARWTVSTSMFQQTVSACFAHTFWCAAPCFNVCHCQQCSRHNRIATVCFCGALHIVCVASAAPAVSSYLSAASLLVKPLV